MSGSQGKSSWSLCQSVHLDRPCQRVRPRDFPKAVPCEKSMKHSRKEDASVSRVHGKEGERNRLTGAVKDAYGKVKEGVSTQWLVVMLRFLLFKLNARETHWNVLRIGNTIRFVFHFEKVTPVAAWIIDWSV